jgi:phosphopentomutase
VREYPGASLFVTIVLDGVGIGAQPDSAAYGDEEANTLAHVCEAKGPDLPNLEAAGLGCIAPLAGVNAVENPSASWGRMREASAGKDSTTGHWELAGLNLREPLPTYAERFPKAMLLEFQRLVGVSGVLGNEVASGTEILTRLGEEHMRSGWPIVYTSADSVFQIAAHVDVVPLERLYSWCEIARHQVCVGPHEVGRVIARPFSGAPGAFVRPSGKRRDFSRKPTAKTLQESLQGIGVRTVSIGKVADLFGGIGFDESHKTGPNPVGLRTLVEWISAWDGRPSFVWVNLIDFDQEYGHRNNPAGFAACLEEFDRALPSIRDLMPQGSGLFITADHGNDPTTPGTDHTREYVPVLLFDGEPSRALAIRDSFNDHAATVLAWFGAEGVPGAEALCNLTAGAYRPSNTPSE